MAKHPNWMEMKLGKIVVEDGEAHQVIALRIKKLHPGFWRMTFTVFREYAIWNGIPLWMWLPRWFMYLTMEIIRELRSDGD